MENFDRAFELIIGVEGDYSNDPRDAGGETKFGISKRAHPNEDIKNLTIARAKEIYRNDYWDKIEGDNLPWPLSLFVFDSAVNQGVVTAKILLQRALKVKADGVFGRVTLEAAKRKEAAALFMARRAQKYFITKGYDIYGDGWLNRLFTIALEK